MREEEWMGVGVKAHSREQPRVPILKEILLLPNCHENTKGLQHRLRSAMMKVWKCIDELHPWDCDLGFVNRHSKQSSFTKDLLVVIASGFHLFPFRTEKLSRSALMVLPLGGRVGRCQLNTTQIASFVDSDGAFVCLGSSKMKL